MQDRIDLQQMLYTIMGRAIENIDANKQSEQITRNITTNLSCTPLSDSVELTKIQLSTFSKAYEDWPASL